MNNIDDAFRKKSALRNPTIDRAGNVSLNEGDRAGYQANAQRPAPSIASRSDQFAMDSMRRAQEADRAASRARYAQPAQPAAAAAEPIKPVRSVTGEPAAKPTLGERIKAKMPGMGGTATPEAPGKRYQPKGIGAKVLSKGAGALAKVAAPIAGIQGGLTGLNTPTSDYAKRFGVNNPTTVAGDLALRTGGVLSDVGNAVLLGSLDSRFADKRAQAAAAPAAAVPAAAAEQPRPAYVSPYAKGLPGEQAITPVAARTGGADEVIGVFNGRPITRGASDQLAGAQSFGGPTTVAESPLRRPNLDAMGSGFAQAPSRASAINERFDAVAKQIQDLHGSSKFGAKGSLATKLLRLEEARAQALGVDQNAVVDSQGNLVNDLGNKRSNETGLYNADLDERSALRRETGESARARVVAAGEALKSRQAMSEQQLELAKERAKAMATDKDGKVDQQAYLAALDDIAVNFAPTLDGTAADLGQSAGELGEAAMLAGVRNAQNVGSNFPSATLGNFNGAAREPTLGDVFDKRTNIGLRDWGRGLVDDIIPGVDDAEIYEGADGNSLRARSLTPDQIRLLKKQGKLRGGE
jgi:hypothetical protein